MRNTHFSKLVYFLAALDSKDRKQFRDFLQSPVFNKQEEPRQLYAYIEKDCLRKKLQEIDDDKAAKFIWGKETGKYKKLAKVKTNLLQLFLDYLEFRNWQGNSGLRKAGLLEELNRLDDQTYFEQYYRKAIQTLSKAGQQDLNQFRHLFSVEYQKMVQLQRHGTRSDDNHFDALGKALEKKLLGLMLKYSFVADNQSHIIGKEAFPAWIRESAEAASANLEWEEPLLEIYHLLNRTRMQGAEWEDLQRLKTLIREQGAALTPAEVNEVFTGALNNFYRQGQLEGSQRLEEIFSLYQLMVDVYAREKGQRLVPWHFKNIVSIGARLGQFTWVESLLDEGQEILRGEAEVRERALAYNRGVLLFYEQRFQEAIRQFNLILPEVRDIFYASDARAYLLMCFFETNDTVGMDSLVHSFRMFLSRSDRVSEEHKAIYLEFMRLFRRTIALPPKDDFRLQQLKAEIEALKFSAGKSWLLKKIGAL